MAQHLKRILRHESGKWFLTLCAAIIFYACAGYFPFPIPEKRLYEAAEIQLYSATQDMDSAIQCMETPGRSSVYYLRQMIRESF